MKEEDKKPGFNCPNCDTLVEITLKALLSKTNFSCPNCKTKFEMDKKESEEALNHTQKLKTLINNIESVKGKMNN